MTNRNPHLEFLALLVASIALWWQPLGNTLRLALDSDAHTHILLILPLSAALIWLKRKTLQRTFEQSSGLGLALLVAALLVAGLAKWAMAGFPDDIRLTLSMFGLVTWWIASVVFCFGVRTFRLFLFPLCFLYWIAPLPAIALNEIIVFLQHQSAFAARVLFLAAGVPVAQDGIMLFIPGLDIEVARECSSIRSSLMLIVTTMVLAHLFLRSWWRKALLMAAAVPLSVAKNGLRIFVIAELGTRVDPGYLDGRLHHHGGIVFWGTALVAVIVLVSILKRTEMTRPQALGSSAMRE